MLAAPDLDVIYERLQRLNLEKWGPEGIRYVCMLFWNDLGYRHLANTFGASDWATWSMSSGEFWDLFLGGCYMYAPERFYGETALPLSHDGDEDAPPFYWSRAKSAMLIHQVEELAHRARPPGSLRPWTFAGPIEIVAIAARRLPNEKIHLDWASCRGATIRSVDLPEAVGSYTEAHVTLNPDDIPTGLPTPGTFEDEVWPVLKRQLMRAIPRLGKLFEKARFPAGN